MPPPPTAGWRRLALLGLFAGFTVAPAPVRAHEPATVVIVAPAAGERVDGRFRLVLEGRGGPGTEAAAFTVLLDGEPVDVLGRVGSAASLFRSHHLAGGERLELTVSADPGRHEVRVRYALDADSATPDVSRSFVVAGRTQRGLGARPLAALVAAAAAVVAAALIRRRALARRPAGEAAVEPGSADV